jgi:hypothetical protein
VTEAGTLRWTLAAFAATIAALAAAAPFTHIGRLHATEGRFWIAVAAAAIAPAALAGAAMFARALVPAALAAGLALALFAWAANPPQHHAVAAPAPSQLDIAGAASGNGIEISNADAGRLLATHGIPGADVESYVLSFYGPIDAETLQPGMTFWRYSSYATGQGRFLTTSRFSSNTVAQLALHLSWTNRATCRAPVHVTKRTVVLVGYVAFGEPGVKQYVILEPDAFAFGHGSAYTATKC